MSQRTSSPLSGNEPPYNTLSRTIVNQHHETDKDRIRKTNTAKDARKETRMNTKVHGVHIAAMTWHIHESVGLGGVEKSISVKI